MRGLRGFFVRLAGLFSGQRRDGELAAEIESHLHMHTEDNLRRGLNADDARGEERKRVDQHHWRQALGLDE